MKMKFKSKNSTRTVNKRQKKRGTTRKSLKRKSLKRKQSKQRRKMKGGEPDSQSSVVTLPTIADDDQFPDSHSQYPDSAIFEPGNTATIRNRRGAGGDVDFSKQGVSSPQVRKYADGHTDNLHYEWLVAEFLQKYDIEPQDNFLSINESFISPSTQLITTGKRSRIFFDKDNVKKQTYAMPLVQGFTLGAFLRKEKFNDFFSMENNENEEIEENLYTLYGILFQVYAALYCYQNIFTHCDLHVENIMLEKPINAELFYFTYYHDDNNTETKFFCPYKIKVIDFGRAWIPQIDEICEPDDTSRLCEVKNSKMAAHKHNKHQDLRLLQSCVDQLRANDLTTGSISYNQSEIHYLFDIKYRFFDNGARQFGPPDNPYFIHYNTENVTGKKEEDICYDVNDAMKQLANLIHNDTLYGDTSYGDTSYGDKKIQPYNVHRTKKDEEVYSLSIQYKLGVFSAQNDTTAKTLFTTPVRRKRKLKMIRIEENSD